MNTCIIGLIKRLFYQMETKLVFPIFAGLKVGMGLSSEPRNKATEDIGLHDVKMAFYCNGKIFRKSLKISQKKSWKLGISPCEGH